MSQEPYVKNPAHAMRVTELNSDILKTITDTLEPFAKPGRFFLFTAPIFDNRWKFFGNWESICLLYERGLVFQGGRWVIAPHLGPTRCRIEDMNTLELALLLDILDTAIARDGLVLYPSSYERFSMNNHIKANHEKGKS